MRAKFLLETCPAITCQITQDGHCVRVSVWLSEVGTNYLGADPSDSLREKYSGEYQNIEDLPPGLFNMAGEEVLAGRGSFDNRAAKVFGNLPSTCATESKEFYKTIRRRVEDKLRKTVYQDEVLECALIMGVSLEIEETPLATAYKSVMKKYKFGGGDPLKLEKKIQDVDICDQRSLDVCDRFRSASMAGDYHDTESTLEIKQKFRKKYNICPEI